MAGGKEQRWGRYLGVHKHLLKINGERLLDRTVRLLLERGARDITVVAKYPEYDVPGADRVYPLDLENGGAVASRDFWSDRARTTVLFGDVYFTDEAMDRICAMMPSEFTAIGRSKASQITGCPYAEFFGFSLLPENHARVDASITRIKDALATGEIKSCGGWAIYRHLQGLPLRKHRCRQNFLNINDFTEDFDVPEDYDRWIERFEGRYEAPDPPWWQFWNRAA
jgi:molybdopterin-guanine dinucleotide biosynthesis protein A